MDLTSLTEDELQQLANVGNFAAMAELANRRSPDNTMKSMTPIERENLRNAIARNLASQLLTYQGMTLIWMRIATVS